jgi:quercetin dioxygenase-like cupin family protein
MSMSEYTKINIGEVEDLAPQYGMDQVTEARFARGALGAQQIGMAYYAVKPGQRLPFGHRHADDEEVYLVHSGAGRFKVGDDVFDVGPRDVVFVPPDSMRSWEAGEDGMELIAFGGHTEGAGADMDQAFWPA